MVLLLQVQVPNGGARSVAAVEFDVEQSEGVARSMAELLQSPDAGEKIRTASEKLLAQHGG